MDIVTRSHFPAEGNANQVGLKGFEAGGLGIEADGGLLLGGYPTRCACPWGCRQTGSGVCCWLDFFLLL